MGQEIGFLLLDEIPLCCPLDGARMEWDGDHAQPGDRRFVCTYCDAYMPMDTLSQLVGPILNTVWHQ